MSASKDVKQGNTGYFPLYQADDPRTGLSRLVPLLNYEVPGSGFTLSTAMGLVIAGEAEALGDATGRIIFKRGQCERLLDLAYIFEHAKPTPLQLVSLDKALDELSWLTQGTCDDAAWKEHAIRCFHILRKTHRVRDDYKPLLKIAVLMGPAWFGKAMEACSGPNVRMEKSQVRLALLRDIRDIFFTLGVDRLGSGTLRMELCATKERGWLTYNGNLPVTCIDIAKLLGHFDIVTTAVNIDTKMQMKLYGKVRKKFDYHEKGYYLEDSGRFIGLSGIFKKYLGNEKPRKVTIIGSPLKPPSER